MKVYEALERIVKLSAFADQQSALALTENLRHAGQLAANALEAWNSKAEVTSDEGPFGKVWSLHVSFTDRELQSVRDPNILIESLLEKLKRSIVESEAFKHEQPTL